MNITRKPVFSFLTVAVLILFSASTIFAGPEGPTVISGEITISYPNDYTTDVTQTTPKGILEWVGFDLKVNEIVNYFQPGVTSITLNNITGGNISYILGTINAVGNVWFVNPCGIRLGPSASVNAAGFLASTMNISNRDFLNNAYVFTKSPNSNGYILNQGEVTVKNGGYVALLGGGVENEGVIEAKLGKVILASGEKIVLELDSEGTIAVAIDEAISEIVTDNEGREVEDAVLNTGDIIADGGTIMLTAEVLEDIFENAVNNEGLIRANSLVINSGEVYLLAKGKDARASNTGTIDVSASETGADGGFVDLSGDRLNIDGTIDVSSIDGEGGTLLLDPVNLYIVDKSHTEGSDNWFDLDSTVGELWLEGFGGGDLIMFANENVYFLLIDNVLSMQTLPTETFTVQAGNHINLNDDAIVTNGGNVELFSDFGGGMDGKGDVLLGVNGGIATNGGDVTLGGANVNVSAPVNTGGGAFTAIGAKDVTHGANGDVATGGGSFTGIAGNVYNFRNASTVDTAGGAFNVTAPTVIYGAPYTQTEYIFWWEYVSGDRDYYFKEFGYYYDDGGLKHVTLAKSFDIGKDGTPLLSGAGVIYGEDFMGLELYTAFEWGGVPFHRFYQDPTLNPGGLDHLNPAIPGGFRYEWEDIVDLGDQDFNDAIINFIHTMTKHPPKKIPPNGHVVPASAPFGLLGFDMRFKIPRKQLTDTFQITYTHGPIELASGQVYFYHPLTEMSMHEMPVVDVDAYKFIDGRINTTSPALLPLIQPSITEEE
ncbi:filamentous hemagglutinin N-terminal domain-containing protein [Omnitrophica bacterium]|nr:filamentous hemagglutinin N-terminal domain-containing protein [Candidatus Omnitrophota bacterium]